MRAASRPIQLIALEKLVSDGDSDQGQQILQFETPQTVRLIRLPRASCFIHYELKHYENQFVKNNFWLEIYGLDADAQKYRLLHAKRVNTDKAVQEYLIPVEGHLRFSNLVFKGGFSNTLVVVYAENSAGSGEQTGEKEGHSGEADAPQNNYNLISENVNSGVVEGLAIHLPADPLLQFRFQQMYQQEALLAADFESFERKFVPQLALFARYANILPSLFFGGQQESEEEKETTPELILSEIEKFGSFLANTVNRPKGQLSENDLQVYFSSLIICIGKLRLLMKKSMSEYGRPFFFETQTEQNRKITPELANVVRAAVDGRIGGECEQLVGHSLLCCVANSPGHVESLADVEFLMSLLTAVYKEPLAGMRLSAAFFSNFKRLCMNGKFRDQLVNKALNDTVARTFNADLPLNRKNDSNRSKHRENERRRERPSNNEETEQQRQKSKTNDGNQPVTNVSNADFVQRLNFKHMLLSTSKYTLNKRAHQHCIFMFIHYSRAFAQKTKSLYLQTAQKQNILSLFEDNYFNLQLHFRMLKELTKQSLWSLEEPPRIQDELTVDADQVHTGKGSIFQIMTLASRRKSRAIDCALVSFYNDELFLEYLLLYLSNTEVIRSALYEHVLLLACQLLFFIANCRGGIALLLTKKDFIQSICRLLQLLFESEHELFSRCTEHSFTKIRSKDVHVHSRFLYTGTAEKDWLATASLNTKIRISAIAGQYGLFFQNLNSAVSVMDEVSQKFMNWDNHQELSLALTQFDKLMLKSPLSAQATHVVLRESYFFDILMELLKVDSAATFARQQFEVMIACKMLYQFLREERGKSYTAVLRPLRDVLTHLERVVQEHLQTEGASSDDSPSAALFVHLWNLSTMINPFERLRDDFQKFRDGFQNCSRYTNINISTLLGSKGSYLTVEREFPKLDPKKYYARLTDYISFFKTAKDPENRLNEVISYLKAILWALKDNLTLYTDFVEIETFDKVNFLALVGVNIVQSMLGGSHGSRGAQAVYSHSKNQLIEDYLDLAAIAIKVQACKVTFKEGFKLQGKEYNNPGMFFAVVDMLSLVKDMNPGYFNELIADHVFDLDSLRKEPTGCQKLSLSRFKLASRIRSWQLSVQQPTFPVYLTANCKQKATELLPELVRFLILFARFPGSYDALLTELIFVAFERPLSIDVTLCAIALFIREPINWKNREKVEKMKEHIKNLFFEKARTGKKSTVVLLQRHGCTRPDSQFDIHMSERGYKNTISYLIDSYASASDSRVFVALGFLITAMVEWKDHAMCKEIAVILKGIVTLAVSVLMNALELNDHQIEHPQELIMEVREWVFARRKDDRRVEVDRVLYQVKKIGRLVQFVNFVALTGVLKLFLEEEDIATRLFILLDLGRVYRVFENAEVEVAWLNTKLEVMKLLGTMMDSNVGFAMQPGQGLSDDKEQTDILRSGNCFDFIEMINKELEVREPLYGLIGKGQAIEEMSETERLKLTIVERSLEMLEMATRNSKVRLISCYSGFSKPPSPDSKPLLDLRSFTSMLFDKSDDLSQDLERSRRNDKSAELKDKSGKNSSFLKPEQVLIVSKRILGYFDYYLRSALNLIPLRSENSFVYCEFGMKAIGSALFHKSSLKGNLDRLFDTHKRITALLSKDPLASQTMLSLKALETYATSFDRERKKVDRIDTSVVQVPAKERLIVYMKRTQRFESPITELTAKRHFLANFFAQMNRFLELKQQREGVQKPISREMLETSTKSFLSVKCDLNSQFRVC